jgi:rare lipoprotein A
MKNVTRRLLLVTTIGLTMGYAATAQSQTITRKKQTARIQYGTASYYADKFEGRLTASGEKFSQKRMTAAHNGLPMGTWIKVTNMRNKKVVVVKVNDRLHHRNTRLVDLSSAAAAKLGYKARGLTKVKIEVLGKAKPVETASNHNN